MSQRQQQIATLEQDASRLVDELGALKREVSSYKTATNELDKAQTALAGLVEQTRILTGQTHKLIATANEIGSAKIFAQLETIQMALGDNQKTQTKRNSILLGGFALVVLLQVILLVMLSSK